MKDKNIVKKHLDYAIKDTIEHKKEFVHNPEKAFTRNRKFDISNLINFILSMQGNSLNKELLDFAFNNKSSLISSSAFVQQRAKLKPEAFKNIFLKFINQFNDFKLLKGYRILAADGCIFQTPFNSDETATYIFNGEGKRGWNRLHLSALYDVINKVYIDANIKPGKQQNEQDTLIEILSSNQHANSIIIADRGYESYKVLKYFQENNQKYVVRVKAPGRRGILTGIKLNNINDEQTSLTITTSKIDLSHMAPGYYKRISIKRIDALKAPDDLYTFYFRIVKIKLNNGDYEYLLTNLSKDEFSTEEIQELYHMRWGIESSFRELKYALGALAFHSKKIESTMQELYAKLIMYNFCELITTHIFVKSSAKCKHTYQVNHTVAAKICLKYFQNICTLSELEKLIKKYILPIRPGRNYPRNKHRRDPLFFNYRIS